MSKLICVNIQELKDLGKSFSHNLRMKPPSYLIDKSDKNIDICHCEDISKFSTKKQFEDYQKDLTNEIKQDYLLHNKQKMQDKTILFKEAVISFGREQFEKCNVNDVNKELINFVAKFEKKYKVKVLSHSLHLDEGHIDENGKKEHNYHAHFQIVNYSFETHKTGLRNVNYSNLQTELFKVFEPLGFERGRNYRQEQKQENQKAEKEGRNALKIEKPINMPHFQFRRLKTAKNGIEKEKLDKQLKEKKEQLEKLQEIERLNNEFIKKQQNKIDKIDKDLQEKQECLEKLTESEIKINKDLGGGIYIQRGVISDYKGFQSISTKFNTPVEDIIDIYESGSKDLIKKEFKRIFLDAVKVMQKKLNIPIQIDKQRQR